MNSQLARSDLLHVEETSINIGGTRHWRHVASTAALTWFAPHAKRGAIAMEAMGSLPNFMGVVCHDHWQPSSRDNGTHALCHAHHRREVERTWAQDPQQWAKDMPQLLLAIHHTVEAAGGGLSSDKAVGWRQRY